MPKSWLVTWNTYGSWLPGDPRGFRTWRRREYIPSPKRFNNGENETYEPSQYRLRHEYSRSIVEEAIHFDDDDKGIVLNAVVAELNAMPVEPCIVGVSTDHVHLLARFGEISIRQAVARLKAGATRTVKGHFSGRKRIWAKNCHMKSIVDDEQFQDAFHYIDQHRNQGALVYVWGQH